MIGQLATRSFRHGIHPAEHKETAQLPLERMPFVERYVLPLGQHIGAPSRAVVKVGQDVRRGELLAEPGGFVSVALHSPVDGRVVGIGLRRHANGQRTQAIEVAIDPYSSQRTILCPTDPEPLSLDELCRFVQAAGLVGMGGAAFPSHVKYAPSEGKKVRWLVVNGSECEPYLSNDHRLMVERPEAVIRGVDILARKLGAEGTKIGVELNKGDAVAALRRAAAKHPSIEVVPLRVKYPQGAEKMLINAIFKQEVPAGKLPIDLEMIVNNVATMAAVADAFDQGKPLIERVVTVAGPGVLRPANLIVPIGTPVDEVLRYCRVKPGVQQVILGGPMMGQPVASTDVPVMKGTSGVLAFLEPVGADRREHPCIRCGRCLEACANLLNPSRLARLARARRYEESEAAFVMDCMECGACSYACPSSIPIVQLIRVAKGVLREQKARAPA